jgi:hypothetical protein
MLDHDATPDDLETRIANFIPERCEAILSDLGVLNEFKAKVQAFDEDEFCASCGRRRAVILGGYCATCDRDEPQSTDYDYQRDN